MAKITKAQSKHFNDKVIEMIKSYGGKEIESKSDLLRSFEIPFAGNKFIAKIEPVQEGIYTIFGRFETFTEKLGELFEIKSFNTKCNIHSESEDNALFRFELILKTIKSNEKYL